MFRFAQIFIIILFVSCTGLNLRVPMTSNTHPIPEYANSYIWYKGGLVFHSASAVKFVASAELEREGKACSYSILYLIAYGDSSIYSAQLDAGISRIGLIEERITAIFGSIYHRHCTIVKGE